MTNKSKKSQGISSLAIVNLNYNTAYNLSVKQNQSYLREHGITHIAADGFYSKIRFIDGICELGFHQNCRLRNDENLCYLYKGPQREGKGRAKSYDGKVKFDDLSRWEFIIEVEPEVLLYTAVLNSPCFKRNLNVVYLLNRQNPEKQRYALFFSTDLILFALVFFNWYRAHFQIEFIFRDAKQFTGVANCQARKKEALHFHFNASLTTLNLLKKQDRELNENSGSKVCSIASWKARYFNEHLLDRFISHLDLDPIFIKNTPQYEELRNYGVIAA